MLHVCRRPQALCGQSAERTLHPANVFSCTSRQSCACGGLKSVAARDTTHFFPSRPQAPSFLYRPIPVRAVRAVGVINHHAKLGGTALQRGASYWRYAAPAAVLALPAPPRLAAAAAAAARAPFAGRGSAWLLNYPTFSTPAISRICLRSSS